MTATLAESGLGDVVDAVLRDHLPGTRTRKVVMAMSKDDNPKATVLAFADDAVAPALVVKVALTAGAADAVQAEARALRLVQQMDAGRLAGTVPRLVDFRREPGCTLLLTSAQPGAPMSADYHGWRHTASRRSVVSDFGCVDAWLRELSAFSVDPGVPPDWGRRIRERWPADRSASATAEVVADLQARLRTPLTHVVHGDFWCGNVLRQVGRVSGVVDWEHASFGADSLRDRVRFALSYALYLDRHTRSGRPVAGHAGLRAGRWGESLRYAMAGDSWLSDLVAEFVGAGLAASGRSPELWAEALLLGLAEIAALSDHPDFAQQHLQLIGELSR